MLLTTTFASATALEATMPMSTLLDAGRYGVTVSTGSDVVSLPKSFDLRNPTPQPSIITPSSVTEGAAAVTVTIDGTGFTKASEVLAAGAPLVTTFLSAQRLRVTIPATQLATARSISLVVRSPSPGGGTATAKTFTVHAAAPGSSSGGTGGGGAACVYRCVDYGYAPGQCFEDWYCIADGTYAGCLGETACL